MLYRERWPHRHKRNQTGFQNLNGYVGTWLGFPESFIREIRLQVTIEMWQKHSMESNTSPGPATSHVACATETNPSVSLFVETGTELCRASSLS